MTSVSIKMTHYLDDCPGLFHGDLSDLVAEDSIKSSTATQGGDSLQRPDPGGLRDSPVGEEFRTTGLS